jgi:hypothetical protein
MVDKVLLQHLDVCFGQAMSVVVACVVYVAAKLLQANVTFRMVTEVSRLIVDHLGWNCALLQPMGYLLLVLGCCGRVHDPNFPESLICLATRALLSDTSHDVTCRC